MRNLKRMEVYQRRMSPCSNFTMNKFQSTHQILLRKLEAYRQLTKEQKIHLKNLLKRRKTQLFKRDFQVRWRMLLRFTAMP